ncbi:MAG TPA: 2,3-bisphosphoglycerate-independent phosphoglycerate mutase [Candidatus Gastranaerophilaceae bacterium]|nr:2,3-bisphosphoglycerate-independent phosphoglycerate mutase [Candidatus Gastranaerophilaceae bacterium]
MNKRVLLCIMDGWGISENNPETNATILANPVNIDSFKKSEKYTQIHADGEWVGLPDGQMGNSEVGHLNLGAGRVVYQELTKINKSIREGDFFKNEKFLEAINHAKQNNSALHLFGLVSDGGVHSSMDHLAALIKLAADNGLKKIYVHGFLDGRDTPPQSACKYLQQVEDELKKYNLPSVASVMGRYWAMDRDNRWDRVEKAYNNLLFGEGEKAASAVEAVQQSYAKGENDEFVKPTQIGGEESRIKDNDSIIFFNFRPDRAREITKAINFENFSGFERKDVRKNLHYTTMTQYDETFNFPVAFPPQKLNNLLGDVLEKNGIKQFRTAETEKYAHVTFFFNGGIEEPNPNETRVLVPSPKVATYDLQPEMSAPEVCQKVLEAQDNPDYGFILVNFANPDMVGHTGDIKAATKACKVVDECVGKIAQKAKEKGITMLLTADHGNSEEMFDPKTQGPQTAHTTNEVPFFVINGDKNIELKKDGALCDVAPTVLKLLDIKKPEEMTGQSLIK